MESVNVTVSTDVTVKKIQEIVHEASKYPAHLEIMKNGIKVDLKSIMGVLSLALYKGTNVTLMAKGNNSLQTLEAVKGLLIK